MLPLGHQLVWCNPPCYLCNEVRISHKCHAEVLIPKVITCHVNRYLLLLATAAPTSMHNLAGTENSHVPRL